MWIVRMNPCYWCLLFVTMFTFSCEADWVFLVICLHVLSQMAQVRWDVLTLVAWPHEKDEALVVSVRVIGSGGPRLLWCSLPLPQLHHVNLFAHKQIGLQNCSHASGGGCKKGPERKSRLHHCIAFGCWSVFHKSMKVQFTVTNSLNLNAVDQ